MLRQFEKYQRNKWFWHIVKTFSASTETCLSYGYNIRYERR